MIRYPSFTTSKEYTDLLADYQWRLDLMRIRATDDPKTVRQKRVAIREGYRAIRLLVKERKERFSDELTDTL